MTKNFTSNKIQKVLFSRRNILANDITGAGDAQCVECGSTLISIFYKEYPYQIMEGRKTLAAGVLGTETAVCFGCRKVFISENSLPSDFVKNLSAGLLTIGNPFYSGLLGRKVLKICREPRPYKSVP